MNESKITSKKNAGMTMVEILVAFVMMLLLIAGFMKAIDFNNDIIRKANDTTTSVDTLEKAYVTDSLDKEKDVFSGELHFTQQGQDTERFSSNTTIYEGNVGEDSLYYFGEHEMVTN